MEKDLLDSSFAKNLEGQAPISLFDNQLNQNQNQNKNDFDPGKLIFGDQLAQKSEEQKMATAQPKEEEKSWIARICPLFSISYFYAI